ncbi:hypothetical protein O6H91_22G034900 [Diphasiastrum complanatum]|uniref:Uncharacterized protein n=1 Tax=Diphasiastrum complanatum TaxID=34168 RepID=A0ACC2AEM5_DIPCM|nr:hypothetical protein O6H91_22G034900 [Diphasiastrum complanatum]
MATIEELASMINNEEPDEQKLQQHEQLLLQQQNVAPEASSNLEFLMCHETLPLDDESDRDMSFAKVVPPEGFASELSCHDVISEEELLKSGSDQFGSEPSVGIPSESSGSNCFDPRTEMKDTSIKNGDMQNESQKDVLSSLDPQ